MLHIKKINLYRLNMTLKNPFITSFGTVQDKDFFIVEVIDRDGLRGYGESVAFHTPWYTAETRETTKHILTDFLIPIVLNTSLHHPKEVTTLFAAIKQHHMAKAALESAIWDLYAKQEDLPLHNLLGGNTREIDVGVSLGIEANLDDLIKKIAHYHRAGYKRIKLKIKPGYDVAMLTHVRKHFPHINIIVDANGAYKIEDSAHLKKLDAFNLMMIEQPLHENALLEHATLQKQLDTPICLDESIHSLDDVKIAHQLGSCSIINIKQARVGGITEAIKIHDYCLANAIPVWCGGMLEAGVGRAHNIALASLANFTIPGDIAGSSHYFAEDIIAPEVVVKNGQIKLSKKAGIGYDINWDTFNQYLIEKASFHA